MKQYTATIYDTKDNPVYSVNFGTVKECLRFIRTHMSKDQRVNLGATITTTDKKYPKGIRKLGEVHYTYVRGYSGEKDFMYRRWINNWESPHHSRILPSGELGIKTR